ncbi:hypothetical protein BIFGAL_04125 [Bifidobacterium gallicum DSM 20093 = LMG 11596]|uniref:Uncharacterized protein n=1 Tax=Bifidobacterium gallicum DSM 20093 = LMG 11596 TaxID=561180 RepID=D1NW78_9BIFI|nr:hypothetical protein BIFGAL_04125 [Bifidobacterium gallicum DSM 20093 = LMG 11596]
MVDRDFCICTAARRLRIAEQNGHLVPSAAKCTVLCGSAQRCDVDSAEAYVDKRG